MKFYTESIEVVTSKPDQMINVTNQVKQVLENSKITNGTVVCFVPHTTSAVTINENADPDVKTDLLFGLSQMVPKYKEFKHYEGNSHAHIKSSIVGASETVIVEYGRMLLGTWQGIYYCEFDGPRTRKMIVRVIGE